MLKTFIGLISRTTASGMKQIGFSNEKFQYISKNTYKAIICSAMKNNHLLKSSLQYQMSYLKLGIFAGSIQ
jgi:hypothetical protein